MQKENYQNTLISIIIPVYNAAPFLPRTLVSVKNQTYSNWELIFVDDVSTDSGVEFLEQQISLWDRPGNPICLLKNERNYGPAVSRNRGLHVARGRYVAYLDADDYWEADKLEKQYRFMEKMGCAFSFTGYEFAGKDGIRSGKIVHVPGQISYQEALTNTVISTITVMLDRGKIPEEVLWMPEECRREDTATWWNILRHGYIAYGMDEALSVYCRHRGSHSSNKLKAVLGTYRMYREQEGLGVLRTMRCMAGYIRGAVRRRL